MSKPAISEARANKLKLKEVKNALKKLEESRDLNSNRLLTIAKEELHAKTRSPNLHARRTLRGHYGKVYALSWSSDNQKLVSASQDGKLIVWNALSGNKVNAITLRSNWVMSCSFSPSGDFIASGGLDNIVSIFPNSPMLEDKLSDCNPSTELSKHVGYISSIKFLNEGECLSSSGDSTIIHWDIEKKAAISTFSDHQGDVMSISLLKGGESSRGLLSPQGLPGESPRTASKKADREKSISEEVGESEDAEDREKKESPGSDATSDLLNLSEYTNLFVSGSCDSTCKLFDIREKKAVCSYLEHSTDVNSVHTINNYNFVSGSDDGAIGMWCLRSHSLIGKYGHDDNGGCILSVTTSKSGRWIIAGVDDKNGLVWDSLTGEKVQILSGHEKRIGKLEMSPNGEALATASWDRTMKIWS